MLVLSALYNNDRKSILVWRSINYEDVHRLLIDFGSIIRNYSHKVSRIVEGTFNHKLESFFEKKTIGRRKTRFYKRFKLDVRRKLFIH